MTLPSVGGDDVLFFCGEGKLDFGV